jgi:hypothetical protein
MIFARVPLECLYYALALLLVFEDQSHEEVEHGSQSGDECKIPHVEVRESPLAI